jgi:hypothetical protein
MVIRFIDDLQIVTTSSSSTVAKSHTQLFNTACAKSFQFVVTDPNSVLCLCPYWLVNVSQLIKL